MRAVRISYTSLMVLLLAFTADRPRLSRLTDRPPETAGPAAARQVRPSNALPADLSGIPFGMFHLAVSEFRPPFTGLVLNGSDPATVMSVLEAARKAKIKVILNMFVSPRTIKNPDGSFSLDRWKGRIDRFASVGLEPYIADGTLIGNYLLDEPHSSRKWNGRKVPYADLEAAAEYSKRRWPGLATLVRADAVYLGKAPFQWAHLDAAWAQYAARRGKVEQYAATQVAAAKEAGLGLVLGLNVLDGGDGSSGWRGTKSKYWAMSAAEVRRYGSVLATEPNGCALLLWKYDRNDTVYFARPEIQAAFEQLGRLAAGRAGARCQVR